MAPVHWNTKRRPTAQKKPKKCKWFTDNVVPSIHGQWLSQTSTLSKQAYTYDAAGRLTQTQNTPVGGKGCITRVYAYEADANRTNLTTREPNAKGECTTTGGTEEKHTYDTADRLNDAGASYSTWGNLTALPAIDAGGKEPSEELASTYYTDNQLASQTQNGETIGYTLDPAERTLETIASGKKTGNITNHYAGPDSSPAWTENLAGETSRNIPGITGSLVAVQNNTEAPVLQLTNLHGDIIATAYLSETATELASKADTSEFGVPTTSLPPKYSWLGALELPTELPSGVTAMGARSYVPELGRFLQPDPLPGGSANAYSYTFGDPVNSADPGGASTEPPGWAIELGQQIADEGVAARKAAEEAAARAAAEAAARAAAAAGPGYMGGGEEEWGEEEVSLHSGAGTQTSLLVEEGLLFRPESSNPEKPTTTVCVDRSRAAGSPCLRAVNIFGEALHFVKHAAKGAWHKFVKVVHYIINARNRAQGGVSVYNSRQTASGCEVIGFLSTFGSPFTTVGAKVGFTVGAPIWASC